MAHIIHSGTTVYTATNPNGELAISFHRGASSSDNVTINYPGAIPDLIVNPNSPQQHALVLPEGTTITTSATTAVHINTRPTIFKAT